MRRSIAALVLAVLLSGCGGREPGSKQLTKGTLHIGCDEAVATLLRHEADQFTHLYTDAVIDIRPEEAREVIARFAADSLRVIAVGRELNKEERDALTAAKVEFREYHVAQTAVAVIANFDVPVKQLRVGELDTIFAGARTRWPGKGGMMIELAVGGLNAGVNEVFRQKVLGGSGYDRAAKPFTSSTMLIEYVGHTRGALGIVGLDWLKDHDAHVTVLGVASPAMRPDSTYAPDEYYTPVQAYVYLGYYPITTPVYIYSREVERDLGDGFIAFVTSVAGQKVVQAGGLVPATMPVRLVQLTSRQVQ